MDNVTVFMYKSVRECIIDFYFIDHVTVFSHKYFVIKSTLLKNTCVLSYVAGNEARLALVVDSRQSCFQSFRNDRRIEFIY